MAKIAIVMAVEVGQDVYEERNWERNFIVFRYRWENMLEIIIGEASKRYNKKNQRHNN